MPIPGILQPDFLEAGEGLRLRRFSPPFEFAAAWYQNPETVWMVDGVKEPYSPEKLRRMYRVLDGRGELYFIEVQNAGAWLPIGDVTLCRDDLPIVIGDPRFRGRGIGRRVIRRLVERAQELRFPAVTADTIYDHNGPSRRCFESVGFLAAEPTEKGRRYRRKLNYKQEENIMHSVIERFLRYVSFDTQSDELSDTCPSTEKQKALGSALAEEMRAMGVRRVRMDENGYVYGTVPGDPALPSIGLIAHMDTSPEASGANIRAKIVPYDGTDVCLNPEKDIWLRERDYPVLKNHRGKHLVVTDGTTLLGADDKAGIAEILTAAEQLMASDTRHATLQIAFTPDEEIGRGPDHFDLSGFGADYAYTVDGGTLGEISYENFNAAAAQAVFRGLNIHPGSAKGKMVNSQYIAMEFQRLLPEAQKPEYTDGYEGFIHLLAMEGTVEHSTLRYIIRDHNEEKFREKKTLMEAAAAFLNAKYGAGTVELTLRDSYYNMRQCMEPVMYVVERAKEAMRRAGMGAETVPIRGGTDGARLSFAGLPCPNLCTGGENYHGRFEFIPVEDMERCVRMLVELMTGVE